MSDELSYRREGVQARIDRDRESHEAAEVPIDTPCQRCCSVNCTDPDSKECSDNCITRHTQRIADLEAELNGMEQQRDDLRVAKHMLEAELARLRAAPEVTVERVEAILEAALPRLETLAESTWVANTAEALVAGLRHAEKP